MYFDIKVPNTVLSKILFSVYLLQNFYPMSFTSSCSSPCSSRSCLVLLTPFFTSAYGFNFLFFLTPYIFTLCGHKNNGQQVTY